MLFRYGPEGASSHFKQWAMNIKKVWGGVVLGVLLFMLFYPATVSMPKNTWQLYTTLCETYNIKYCIVNPQRCIQLPCKMYHMLEYIYTTPFMFLSTCGSNIYVTTPTFNYKESL